MDAMDFIECNEFQIEIFLNRSLVLKPNLHSGPFRFLCNLNGRFGKTLAKKFLVRLLNWAIVNESFIASLFMSININQREASRTRGMNRTFDYRSDIATSREYIQRVY